MNFALILAFASIVTIGLLSLTQANQLVDHPQAHKDAVAEVDQYRMFMYSADKYMKQSGLAPVTVVTAIPWATLKASVTTPPGAKNLDVPGSWKIVVAPDKSWVACTEMEERSIGAISQLVPVTSTGTGSAAVSTSQLSPVRLLSDANSVTAPAVTHVVIGAPANASALAAKCS